MTARQAILDSIAHHKRMQDWARQQPKDYPVIDVIMLDAINEFFDDKYCPLCKKYFDNVFNECGLCPLNLKYGSCCVNDFDCVLNKNLYYTLCYADTYGEFVKAEDAFIAQLESLLVDYPENEAKHV